MYIDNHKGKQVRRSFKYRLFTNINQDRELAIMLETHRRLYNVCLDYNKLAYQVYGSSLNYCDYSRWFRGQRSHNPYFARLNFSSAQATMRRLDRSFVNFFRSCQEGASNVGYPRIKGRDFFNSFEFPSHRDGIRLIGNKLRVTNVGTIRVKLHRPVEGSIKTVILKRESGKWFVIFSCELPGVAPASNSKPPVGIDVGLTSFLTTSSGSKEPNPRYLKTALPEIRIASRSVSRKKKGGCNRRKAVRVLQKIHARVRTMRREHHYQVACRLVLAYGLIAVERLDIQRMLKSGRFSRAISDAGWSGFLEILRHKAEKAGAQFVEVDPKGTTQQCSGCQQNVQKDISVRWHQCCKCGLSLDRDHNAARNILARGLAWTGQAGGNVDHKIKRPLRSHLFYETE